MDERVDEWREFLVRKIRMLAVGLVSVVLPLSLTTGELTPLAQAAVPAATPVIATGLVLPADIVYSGDLFLNPVSNARGGSITATFTGAAKVKNRPVYLYKSTDSGVKWTKVGPKKGVKLSSSGTAVFTVTPVNGVQYKAVAPAHKYKVKKKKRTAAQAVTEVRTLSQDWTSSFSDDFTGSAFGSNWNNSDGLYGAGGRLCAAPKVSMSTVSSGAARLAANRVTDHSVIDAVTAAAKRMQAASGQKQTGCPNGVYDNSRVTTESHYTISTGVVAAEVTFPIHQGSHGGVWLRTVNNASGKFDEIDIVEAFGWKKGIQAVLHLGTNTTYDTPEKAKWVAKKAVGKASWWGKSHVFSIEFTTSRVIYRLDGAITRIDKRTLPNTSYYLVMSMASSDWETGRLKKPVNGGKKGVKLPMSTKVNWIRTWTRA